MWVDGRLALKASEEIPREATAQRIVLMLRSPDSIFLHGSTASPCSRAGLHSPAHEPIDPNCSPASARGRLLLLFGLQRLECDLTQLFLQFPDLLGARA